MVGTVLLLGRLRVVCIRVIIGAVSNLAVRLLLGTLFINRVVKQIFPPEHKIMTYSFAPIPKIATINKAEGKQRQDKKEGGAVKTVTVVEDVYKALKLIRVAIKLTRQPKLEGVILDTTKVRGLVQVVCTA